MTKIGVIGGLGYIGSTLVTELAKNPENIITIYDCNLHNVGYNWFKNMSNVDLITFNIIHRDSLDAFIKNCDQIVNLAAIVGEPACVKNISMTTMVNEKIAKHISDQCYFNNVFMVFISTCSNYGSSNSIVNEISELNPMSLYAETKVNTEKHILNTNPNAIILRMSTVFGVSPSRTRMDIIPAQFIKEGMQESQISIYMPNAIRPIIHVKDTANAIIQILNTDKPHYQVYNVGFNNMNHTKMDMAKAVQKLNDAEIIEVESNDKRTYKVDFSRFHQEFSIKQQHTLASGLDEMFDGILFDNLPLSCGNV